MTDQTQQHYDTLCQYVRAVTTRWNRRTSNATIKADFITAINTLCDYLNYVDPTGSFSYVHHQPMVQNAFAQPQPMPGQQPQPAMVHPQVPIPQSAPNPMPPPVNPGIPPAPPPPMPPSAAQEEPKAPGRGAPPHRVADDSHLEPRVEPISPDDDLAAFGGKAKAKKK